VQRGVVLGEDLGDQLAAAGDVDLVEEVLDVVADSVGRQVKPGGDLGGPVTARDQCVICCSRVESW